MNVLTELGFMFLCHHIISINSHDMLAANVQLLFFIKVRKTYCHSLVSLYLSTSQDHNTPAQQTGCVFSAHLLNVDWWVFHNTATAGLRVIMALYVHESREGLRLCEIHHVQSRWVDRLRLDVETLQLDDEMKLMTLSQIFTIYTCFHFYCLSLTIEFAFHWQESFVRDQV